MTNRYNSVLNNYLQIQKEKEEKNKRKFFDGLILYSNLKKVIDITDKKTYSEKQKTLYFSLILFIMMIMICFILKILKYIIYSW